MLPASHRSAGENHGFPDVCLTPAPGGPVPVAYDNVAMHAQANPFSLVVRLSGVNALNLASKIPITIGDEQGTAHPFIKQVGAFVTGNPVVFIEKLPAINLTCATTGNNMNNAVGQVAVPGASVVSYTRDPRLLGAPIAGGGRFDRTLAPGDIASLSEAVSDRDAVRAERHGGVALLAIRSFSRDLSAQVARALAALAPDEPLVLDVRDNPGGDVHALLALADDFLDRDSLLLIREEPDGDRQLEHARQPDPYRNRLVILVNGATASAAELFAGCLQCHRRAALVGERTFGKGSAQAICSGNAYAAVASYRLPDGRAVDGSGVEPDVVVHGAAEQLRRALSLARG